VAETTFPAEAWGRIAPSDVGIDAGKLGAVKRWLDDHAEHRGYRFVVVRDGRVAVEWNKGIDAADRLHIASANKSLISSALGIAVGEGRIGSADDPAVDYFPEMMDVPPGEGPKEGRYAFPANAGITLRHLICNVSGYMKPDERPGEVYHYQTNGMHVVTHCIERAYGLYDIDDPAGSPKLKTLFREKLGEAIGADWEYASGSQKMHDTAKQSVFGWGSQIRTTALDFARLGWCWLNWGRWRDRQVIPEAWMREATKVAPDILAHCPEDTWQYGHGFWTNERGRMWPALPRDAYMAAGAGGHHCAVLPGLRMVVVTNPLPRLWEDGHAEVAEPLQLLLDAVR
jgi:CubicO group peptidase (beta-lactamase class C family)